MCDLLFWFIQPLQGGVQVVCLVWPDLGAEELCPDDMAQHLFQRLAVLLVDTEQEKGQHQPNHQQCCHIVPNAAPREQIGGDAHQRTTAEADQLPTGQVECHLGLYFGQILGYGDKWHLPRPLVPGLWRRPGRLR